MDTFDIVVIGAVPADTSRRSGPHSSGWGTACVDAWLGPDGRPALGGTCLNVGCIPSKALLDSSHHYHNLRHLLPAHGIEAGDVTLDLGRMLARKDKVVKTLTRGVAGLLRKNQGRIDRGPCHPGGRRRGLGGPCTAPTSDGA